MKNPDAYDENSRLFNYFKYLYDNKLYGIKSLALLILKNITEKYITIFTKIDNLLDF